VSRPQHAKLRSCERMLVAAGLARTGYCKDGQRWQCKCGRTFEHVCDEAEGCSWHEVKVVAPA